jgi:hypothetical protein
MAKFSENFEPGMKHISSILIFLVAGCSPLDPYSQTVVGSLEQSGSPLVGIPVRLVVSPSGQSQPCAPVVAESVTNREGKFLLTTLYSPRWTENFAVLIQHHAVCFQSDDGWFPAWELTTGPARRNQSLRCSLGQHNKVICEA